MNEGALRVEQVELVIEPGPGVHDGSRVRDHTHGALHSRQIAARHDRRRLVVDANLQRSSACLHVIVVAPMPMSHLEPGRAPIDELDGALVLHGGNGGVHVLRHHVAAIEQAHGHVLALSWVALQIT